MQRLGRVILPTLLWGSSALADPTTFSSGMASGPTSFSTAAPDRSALIMTVGHATPAGADAQRYRDLLRQLGFQVTVASPETRPELKGAFTSFAGTIKSGADVAVFVLGTLRPKGEDLYVIMSENTPVDRYATEGLRISDALRPVASAGARDTVLFVDECRETQGQTCHVSAGTVPNGVSAIVGERMKPDGSSSPVAGIASLEPELLPLMKREGLSNLDLFGALKERLLGTNMAVASSPSLSRSFAFLPGNYLQGLADPCNRVEPAADAQTLRNAAPVADVVPSCERAAAIWSPTTWFRDKLATAKEQSAFQAAMGDCRPSTGRAYLDAYPDGRYAPAVRAVVEQCDEERHRAETPPVPLPAPPVPSSAPALESGNTQSTCTVGGLDPAGNNWLALRERPSYRSAWSTTRMGPGTVVSRLESVGEWSHVRLASGETGWANGQFLTCGVPAEPTGRGDETAHPASGCFVTGLDPNGDNWLALRNAPNGKAPWSDRHMGPGTPLAILGSSGPWLHVRLSSGEMGWASGRYVQCSR